MVKLNLNKKKSKFWAGILFAQIILFFLFSKSEKIVSLFVIFFNLKKKNHQNLFSQFLFSFGDVFYLILFLVFILLFINAFKTKSFKKILILFNILYFIYQGFWGMLYFDKPIIEKLPNIEPKIEDYERLAIKYIKLTNETKKKIYSKNQIFKINDLEKTKRDIIKSQSLIPTKFYSGEHAKIKNFKPSLFNKILNFTGILGYYNPFTSEAQYNPNLPSTFLPFTLAHENSHQLGFAREQEANFIAFLICKDSDNLELKYSAYLYASKSLLHYLKEINPKFAVQVQMFYSDEVKEDLKNEKIFFEKHNTLINAFFHITNDLFLKSNQQEGSVTYNYFVNLLAKYETKK